MQKSTVDERLTKIDTWKEEPSIMPRTLMCPKELFGKNLEGTHIIVTGANSGIGFQTTRQLAKQGAKITMACRNTGAGEKAVAKIRAKCSGANLEVRQLDLADLASVRAFTAGYNEECGVLDILINNAGVMNTPESKTKDGFEMQIGINHLGHFLLTELLRPSLCQASQPRILNLSSAFHDDAMGRKGRIDLDDLHFETREYDGWTAYAQSKLANLMHARSLAHHYGETGVTAVSIHPGWVSTRLMRHTAPIWITKLVMRPVFALMGELSAWKGAQSTLYAALEDDEKMKNGSYYAQVIPGPNKGHKRGGWPMVSPNQDANDDALAEQLWVRSMELVGLS